MLNYSERVSLRDKREFKKTTTAKRKSLKKTFNGQKNGSVRA